MSYPSLGHWKGYALALVDRRCLRQVQIQQILAIVLATPVWLAHPWIPPHLELCIRNPVQFFRTLYLLIKDQEVYPLVHHRLAACHVSVDRSKRFKFLQKLGQSYCQPGAPILPSIMTEPGTNRAAALLQHHCDPISPFFLAVLIFLCCKFHAVHGGQAEFQHKRNCSRENKIALENTNKAPNFG